MGNRSEYGKRWQSMQAYRSPIKRQRCMGSAESIACDSKLLGSFERAKRNLASTVWGSEYPVPRRSPLGVCTGRFGNSSYRPGLFPAPWLLVGRERYTGLSSPMLPFPTGRSDLFAGRKSGQLVDDIDANNRSQYLDSLSDKILIPKNTHLESFRGQSLQEFYSNQLMEATRNLKQDRWSLETFKRRVRPVEPQYLDFPSESVGLPFEVKHRNDLREPVPQEYFRNTSAAVPSNSIHNRGSEKADSRSFEAYRRRVRAIDQQYVDSNLPSDSIGRQLEFKYRIDSGEPVSSAHLASTPSLAAPLTSMHNRGLERSIKPDAQEAERSGRSDWKAEYASAYSRDSRLKDLNAVIERTASQLTGLQVTREKGFVRSQQRRLSDKEETLSVTLSPLSQEEEQLVDNALKGRNRCEVLVLHKKSNIDITRHVMQCLLPGVWLNDEVINLYLELLKERETREPKGFLKCHFFNTFFYNKLYKDKRSYDFKAVKRWTTQKKLGYNLLECDKIFVPIHKDIHWCLAIINIREKKFEYLDSLKGQDRNALDVLARYIVDEAKDKLGKDLHVNTWERSFPFDIPKQLNGCDCGMFM
eukprot:c24862_g2_i1 orf=1-1755(-)